MHRGAISQAGRTARRLVALSVACAMMACSERGPAPAAPAGGGAGGAGGASGGSAAGGASGASDAGGATTPIAATPDAAAPAGENAAPRLLALAGRIDPRLTGPDAADPANDARLAEAQGLIAEVMSATALARCDFEIDYDAGVPEALPHLRAVRALTRLLDADAARLIEAEQTEAAAERVESTLRLSVQVAGNARTAVELLTALAVAELAAQRVIATPALAQTSRAGELLAAVDAARAVGVVRSGAIMRSDVELGMAMLTRRGVPGTQALRAVAEELEAAWAAPDAPARLAALEDRAKGSLGASVVMPPLVKVWESMSKVRQSLERARHILVP